MASESHAEWLILTRMKIQLKSVRSALACVSLPPHQTQRLMRYTAFVIALAVIACSGSAQSNPAHPETFVGRWVRLREDKTWGDTMEFMPDGSMRGSTGYPIPPTLQWEVKRDASGTPQYCAMQANIGFCRNYRFSGDTLEMFGGPRGNTIFRRVR